MYLYKNYQVTIYLNCGLLLFHRYQSAQSSVCYVRHACNLPVCYGAIYIHCRAHPLITFHSTKKQKAKQVNRINKCTQLRDVTVLQTVINI